MEKYFIGLDIMTLDELEIWRLLCRYSDYQTNIAGYTINQLVVGADKRLNLTTQKVRTILKKFEREGYVKFLTSGSKGKESTLLLTIKQQLFNNNVTNKSEQLQGVDKLSNNNVTAKQQHYKEKDKKINKSNYELIIETYTDSDVLRVTIRDFIRMRSTIKKPLTDRALKTLLKKLDNLSNNDNEKITILENSIENCWLSVYELKNKKAPVTAGTQNKINDRNSIYKKESLNTEKIKFVNNF